MNSKKLFFFFSLFISGICMQNLDAMLCKVAKKPLSLNYLKHVRGFTYHHDGSKANGTINKVEMHKHATESEIITSQADNNSMLHNGHNDKKLDKEQIIGDLQLSFTLNSVAMMGHIAHVGLIGIPIFAFPIIPQTMSMILSLAKQKYLNALDKPQLIEDLELIIKDQGSMNEQIFAIIKSHKDVDVEKCIKYSEKRLHKLQKLSFYTNLYRAATVPTLQAAALAGAIGVGSILAHGVICPILFDVYRFIDPNLYLKIAVIIGIATPNVWSGVVSHADEYKLNCFPQKDDIKVQETIIALLKNRKEAGEAKKINNE